MSPACSEWKTQNEKEHAERIQQVKRTMEEVLALVAQDAEEATVQARWMDATALLSCTTAPHTPSTNFLRGCCADALGDEVAAMQWFMQACAQVGVFLLLVCLPPLTNNLV